MDYETNIAAALCKALNGEPYSLDWTVEQTAALLEVPKDSSRGDHAFPCFSLAKALRKAPPLIAQELAEAVGQELGSDSGIARVEATGPYLNFAVDRASLANHLIPSILDGSFLEARPSTGVRVMIEYSQPNTHKAFHVGHTRNVALGDALVRLTEWAGHEVVAANYIGDVGTHIAKCLWYYRTFFDGAVPDTHRGEFLGELYAKADELLDFTTLTRAPHPRVVSARVLGMAPHPAKDTWQVVQVQTQESEPKQVVCGGTGYKVGDLVAYATVGSHVGGRLVGVAERDGVSSEGMICSEKEISLSDNAQQIAVLPEETELGVELAEVYRVPGALPDDRPVLDEMQHRQGGVTAILKALEAKEPEIHEQWMTTRQWSLDEFNEIYTWLEARFDHFFYESDVGDSGKKIVQDALEDGILVRSEGAIGADLTQFKLPFFLLLKTDGTGLYSTKDLSLAQLKFDKFGIDRSIYVVDVGQSLHFQQVFRTLELLGYEKAKDCHHLAYGMVMIPEGKMSSRKGNVILFSQLQRRLIEHIQGQFLDQYKEEWPEEEIADAARRIAIGTIKYGMLNQDNRKNIVFDLEDWTNPTGNTGPYLLYAFMRTRAILGKVDYDPAIADWSLLVHDLESEVLRQLNAFHGVLEKAIHEYSLQSLCIYLYDLAKSFSRMYKQCSVKNAETEELRASRATLVDATGRVIQKGLELLGIRTLDRM